MARGGRREGAGRKPKPEGAPRRVSFTWEKIAQAIELSPEKTPLAHLLLFMQNDEMNVGLRLKAAIAAAPYVHPKLASIEIKSDQAEPMKAQSEIGSALSALAELMRQRKTIDGDVVDVDERPTGRGDAVAHNRGDSVARDRMAQTGRADAGAKPVPLLIDGTIEGGDDGQ